MRASCARWNSTSNRARSPRERSDMPGGCSRISLRSSGLPILLPSAAPGQRDRCCERTSMRKQLFAITAVLLAMTAAVHAQTYPSRPITMIVALPAGGAVDALARIISDHMRVTLGQPIVVENMGGAGGTLSIARVVRSAPDGSTLGIGTLGQYVISGAVYTLAFDMLDDLTPIALLPSVP